MADYIRYDTPDHGGDTRRDRNERAGYGHLNPEINVPEHGRYLWDYFWEISSVRKTTINGGGMVDIYPITYHDILAWYSVTGNLISSNECDIIIKIDASYRDALSSEIRANTIRAQQRANVRGS